MVLPLKRGSDGSYSSFSSASSRGASEPRKYLDPWDLENALYVRGKRISFASDPSTYSAASAALGDNKPSPSVDTGYKAMAGSSTESAYKIMAPYGDQSVVYKRPPSSSCVDSGYCYCDYESPSYVDSSALLQPEPVPSMRYLNFCPYCDAEQPKSLPYISSTQSNNNAGEPSVDSCEECSVCSSVAPPPPLLLFSGVGGRALSAAGLSLGECRECQQQQQRVAPSFSPSPRRASVPARPAQAEELAYVYESPRARAKHSLPAIWGARDNIDKMRLVPGHSKRLSLASPPSPEICDYNFTSSHPNEPESLVPLRGPHAQLLAPPRHPCRWGMARSGHIAIDYTNAWMSLARRIRPSRS
ncbi:hypothetical protein B566_EDAN009845 [Ephemera danica]|nr:hypothetical protein B566_EDAN009845 [Ephemera danica]